jgi:hypothetical protein
MTDTAHYRLFVTFRGADFSHSVPMRRERIAKSGSRLRSRKVRENHIINREQNLGDYKGQELLATPMLTAKSSCSYCAFLGFTNDNVRYKIVAGNQTSSSIR